MQEKLMWAAVVVAALFLLYMFSFYLRLGRTQKTISRAVELSLKQLHDKDSLTSEEQAELDDFCRRGILEKREGVDKRTGETRSFYLPSDEPILAELTS